MEKVFCALLGVDLLVLCGCEVNYVEELRQSTIDGYPHIGIGQALEYGFEETH